VPESEKTVTAAPASGSVKRSKTVGIVACLAGILAAVVGLIGFLTSHNDLLYVLLFGGGMLVSVLGLRRMRKARAS